jgi:hypothetical protein
VSGPNSEDCGTEPDEAAAEVENTMIDWGSSSVQTGGLNEPTTEKRMG